MKTIKIYFPGTRKPSVYKDVSNLQVSKGGGKVEFTHNEVDYMLCNVTCVIEETKEENA